MSKYQGRFSHGMEGQRHTQPRQPVKKKKKKSWGFLIFMLLWCVLLLGATAYGLKHLWAYLEIYEVALPEYAIDGYMAELKKEDIYDKTDTLTALIDFNLETEESCRSFVLDSLEGDLVYSLRQKESTDTERVYAILCGKKTIGTVNLSQQAEVAYGLKPWAVTGEDYDLAYLMGTETVSVTAPEGYTVKVNGVELDERYITQRDIHFESMEALYEDYEVPSMVVYEAGPFLSGGELELFDRQGEPAEEDLEAYLNNCTDEETQELDEFVAEFVEAYVAYAGSNKNTRHKNLETALKYVVSGSDLESRMKAALEGLQYGQSKGDEVVSLTRNQCTNVGQDRYYVDITYEVDTEGKNGTVRTTTNAQLILIRTDSGLKTEIMMNY